MKLAVVKYVMVKLSHLYSGEANSQNQIHDVKLFLESLLETPFCNFFINRMGRHLYIWLQRMIILMS